MFWPEFALHISMIFPSIYGWEHDENKMAVYMYYLGLAAVVRHQQHTILQPASLPLGCGCPSRIRKKKDTD
ncbi:MAG: hypothetical protein RL115_162 [Bacteroidota bacterium]|jgi:hypothetical protein